MDNEGPESNSEGPEQDFLCPHMPSIQFISQGEALLTLNTLGKIFSRRHIEIVFSYFPQKTGFDISCRLSPIETLCMKC